ncbi:MAG: lipid IV(A) 3-deoxy-D-manno-octulosonic acid transferase [Burkholderiaceae bacterium]|nr:lipid IV(A) 3-deoxy-D-manno-octulosonic acid transferase [Burkholderiaceae bacterium]
MVRWLYTAAWYLAMPLVLASLLWRSRRQPGYRLHLSERFGGHWPRADLRPLIWIHAVSVGETRAAQPLVARLLERYPEHELLITHMTPTGRQTGEALFASERIHQAYLPYDYPFAVRRFLRAWRPSIGIMIETELWPNLVAMARREGVPMALVNARLSERSLRKGKRWAALIRPALASLDLVLAQSDDDARRLARLGRPAAPALGNLKFDVTAAPALEALGHRWRVAWLAGERSGGLPRFCVIAASTREGEEALLLQAWAAQLQPPALASRFPPLLVIVPRHPQRFDEVAALIEAGGWRMARRSRLSEAQRCDAQILLGDSMGEMAAYYALADVAIIGGSLLPFGGQNLIEACAAGVPVVVGPHTFNFAEAAEQAIEADAAIRAPDASRAVGQALAIVLDPEQRQSMSDHALAFAERHRGATERTLQALAPLIGPSANP